MRTCYHCGKGILYGRSHTHHRGVAGGRWKKRAPKTQRIFSPNLQNVSILDDDETRQVKLCTKCLKRIRFDIEHGTRPFLTLAVHREHISKEEEAKEKSETPRPAKKIEIRAKRTIRKKE